MPSPISNQSHLNPGALQRNSAASLQGTSSHENAAPVASTQPRPGNGLARVNGQMVPMTSVNESGLTSTFPTRNSAVVAQRGRLGINPQRAQHLLSQRGQLAAEASKLMQELVATQLNNYPQAKQHVDQLSHQHYQRVPVQHKDNIFGALEDYQGAHGDNFLMNVAVMGFPDIQTYLQSRDPLFHDESEVDDFMTNFGDHYSAFTGMEDEEEELDELKSRVDDRLKEPSQQLAQYLHNAPRLPEIPLIKGATGGDNPVTTQLDGNKTLESMLNGNALNFNGFLSTSSSYNSALDFSGKMPSTALGQPHYVVDLTKNDEKNEILRRHTLRDLQQGNVDTGSLLFLFKANNAAGISVNATKHADNPDSTEHRLSVEDEILMAPGHFFIPEQIIRNEDGVALIGTLNYGR